MLQELVDVRAPAGVRLQHPRQQVCSARKQLIEHVNMTGEWAGYITACFTQPQRIQLDQRTTVDANERQ